MFIAGLKIVAVCSGALIIYKFGLFPKIIKLFSPFKCVAIAEEDIDSQLLQQFDDACDQLPQIIAYISENDSLYMYARYKQSTCGPCPTKIPPINPKAFTKWRAWKCLGNLSRSDAMLEYVEKCDLLLAETIGEASHPSKTALFQGFSSNISRPRRVTEVTSDDPLEVWFDSVREGELEKVKGHLHSSKAPYELLRCVNTDNDDKLTALHIAADRGYANIVALLVESGADINAIDSDDQTPLHYASACDHIATAKILVEQGADGSAQDCCGTLPIHLAESDQMRALLSP